MAISYSDLSGDVPVLGPIGIAISTLGTTSAQVIGADAVRRGILFHNPGSATLRIAPSNLTLTSGHGGIIVYPQSEEAIYGDELLHVNCAWNAVADSGSNNPLTIFNFTDNNQSVAAPNRTVQLNSLVQVTSPNGIQVSTLGTASQSVVSANPNRRGILFHNPGSVVVAVSPSNLSASIGAGSMVILPGQEKRIIANGRVRVNCAWNAIAASGSGNYLTIAEFL